MTESCVGKSQLTEAGEFHDLPLTLADVQMSTVFCHLRLPASFPFPLHFKGA